MVEVVEVQCATGVQDSHPRVVAAVGSESQRPRVVVSLERFAVVGEVGWTVEVEATGGELATQAAVAGLPCAAGSRDVPVCPQVPVALFSGPRRVEQVLV